MLINQGKVVPFETGIAASIINRLLITYAIEDARQYPFEDDELPPCLAKIQEECMFIVSQILKGNFHG